MAEPKRKVIIMTNAIVTAVKFHADKSHAAATTARGYIAAGLLAGDSNSTYTPFFDAGTVSRLRAAVGKSKSTKSTVPVADAELLTRLATVTKRSVANDKIATEFGEWFGGVERARVAAASKNSTPATKSESEPTKGTGNAAIPEDVDIRALVFDTIVNAKTDADADKFIAALADWATEARVERNRAAKGKTVRKSA